MVRESEVRAYYPTIFVCEYIPVVVLIVDAAVKALASDVGIPEHSEVGVESLPEFF